MKQLFWVACIASFAATPVRAQVNGYYSQGASAPVYTSPVNRVNNPTNNPNQLPNYYQNNASYNNNSTQNNRPSDPNSAAAFPGNGTYVDPTRPENMPAVYQYNDAAPSQGVNATQAPSGLNSSQIPDNTTPPSDKVAE
jgi:hypothetical protein